VPEKSINTLVAIVESTHNSVSIANEPGPESTLLASTATAPWLLFNRRQRRMLLLVLFLVATSNFFDKNVISILLEPIKQDFHVTDTMLGLLSGFCFAAFYAIAGVPVARWADCGNRRTVITTALVVWSAMTSLCGLAQSFWQLALARVGVGAGESGAIPPAHSLIADYFAPETRATALAILTSAGTAGSLLGVGLGGYIAATLGWRAAFLFAGVPGIALAVLARCTLAEPRLQLGFPGTRAPTESLRETLARLKLKRSYLYALTGCILYTFVFQGGLLFVPSFLVRVLHVPLKSVSVMYGGVVATASVVGTLGGGWIADRLGKRDVGWLARIPTITCIAAAPVYILALSGNDFPMFLMLVFIGQLLLASGLPAILAAIHAVCGTRRRAMAIAIMYFTATLVGSGFGPLVTGAISDGLGQIYGAESLRSSLIIVVAILLVAGASFYKCAGAMTHDLED